MKKLSEFLAQYIGTRTGLRPGYTILELVVNGIEAYKQHLQDDSPKTVQWAMIEKRLITALERMESNSHFDGLKQYGSNINRSNVEKIKHPVYCPQIGEFLEKEGNEINTAKCDFNVRIVRECSRSCQEPIDESKPESC